MQVETTVIYHYTSTRTDEIIIFKIVIIPNVGKDAEILDLSYIASGNVKGYSYNGKIVW